DQRRSKSCAEKLLKTGRLDNREKMSPCGCACLRICRPHGEAQYNRDESRRRGCETIASRMYRTALRWLAVAMARNSSARRFIPGAGCVLRIEKRGGDWLVVTSLGFIASGPARN